MAGRKEAVKNLMSDYQQAKSSSPPGGGGRFAALKKVIASKGGVKNPAAVAASIGRKKYGAKKMASFASKGKKK